MNIIYEIIQIEFRNAKSAQLINIRVCFLVNVSEDILFLLWTFKKVNMQIKK